MSSAQSVAARGSLTADGARFLGASCAVGRTEIDVLRSVINNSQPANIREPFRDGPFVSPLSKQCYSAAIMLASAFLAQNVPFNPLISRPNSLPQ